MPPLGEYQFAPSAVMSGNRRAERNGVSTPWPPQHRTPDDPPVAMRLLAAGVPLSLLLDLAAPSGPDSERIAAAERVGSH